jgi:prepilin-type N-terminal cleavage/methylation domain-containing protein
MKNEAGFTLVEALVAMVVLAVGITAVANLMLVGASSNAVGNASTASAAIASRELERLKAIDYLTLATGGDLETDQPGFNRDDAVPGVGIVHTRWTVQAVAGTQSIRFITVRSEGTGAMTRARSRAQFTVFRSCTDTLALCP